MRRKKPVPIRFASIVSGPSCGNVRGKMPSTVKSIPAREALDRLIEGNKRFVENRRDGKPPAQRDASWLLAKPGGPFAIILSCSDSRAPAEILFDQGLGDLFVIRVAGNVVAPSQVGSVEFAAATSQAQLVVVMGHTECGVIKVTLDSMEGRGSVSAENVQSIVERIRPNLVSLMKVPKRSRKRDRIWNDAVRANVLASTNHLRHGSRFLEELVREKKLAVIGAEFCLDTGAVDFFDNPLAELVKKKKPRR